MADDDAPDGSPQAAPADDGPWSAAPLAAAGPPPAVAALWNKLADAVEGDEGAFQGAGEGAARRRLVDRGRGLAGLPRARAPIVCFDQNWD